MGANAGLRDRIVAALWDRGWAEFDVLGTRADLERLADAVLDALGLERVGWLMEWDHHDFETGEMVHRKELRHGSRIPSRDGTRAPVYRLAAFSVPGEKR